MFICDVPRNIGWPNKIYASARPAATQQGAQKRSGSQVDLLCHDLVKALSGYSPANCNKLKCPVNTPTAWEPVWTSNHDAHHHCSTFSRRPARVNAAIFLPDSEKN